VAGLVGRHATVHTPVFVLTHHARPSLSLSDTTFHFIDTEPAEALRQAKAAADRKDVRLGGGVSTVRAFLEADLVDTMHVALVPVQLGRGGKLWDSPDELLDRFHLEQIPSPSGVTHHLFWRR
jgi:dihydrofolate reductase